MSNISAKDLRGVIMVAVALSLPDTMPGCDLMLVATFAAIFATVLVHGTTLGLVIRWAALREDEHAKPPLDLFAAEAAMLRAQLAAMKREAYASNGAVLHPRLLDTYQHRATISAVFTGSDEECDRDIAARFDVVLAAIAVGRIELVRLHRAHQIDDETLRDLTWRNSALSLRRAVAADIRSHETAEEGGLFGRSRSEARRPLFQSAYPEAVILLSARLSHFRSLKCAKPDVQLCAHSSH